ncbi:uncharacterized protein G2W53_019554 [Senna tora]|uniref:Uncharacterized protein n=1 Tax=Senna tora TaxID=362788 RepID=A0A834TTP8_9FABA|nr:uncharacterized protein G2W53_019554 [Senna tora]
MHPWKLPLWARCGRSDRCTLGSCLFGLGVVVPTDAPLESPLWARCGRSDRCTFGSCLFGLGVIVRTDAPLEVASLGIIVLPCDRRIFHFSEKGLPIDEGILRLSLLGNFSSLIGERIFRPSSRRRDISSIPLEGSFIPRDQSVLHLLIYAFQWCPFEGVVPSRGRSVCQLFSFVGTQYPFIGIICRRGINRSEKVHRSASFAV